MKRIGRKLVMICLVMLALCVSAGAVGSAFDRLDFIRREGFTTEIVDVYGEVYTYDGVLNVSTLEEYACVEEMASYAILFEGEEVLTAQLHDIYAVPEGQSAGAAAATNGYYSVTFYIGDSSEKEVFMTGLTPENQKKVQDANIAAVLNGTAVSLDDLAFIDAEKQYVIRDEGGYYMDSDQDLCWAAAASNVLHYTGWGKKAGFGSADYLLEHFAACFEDGGSRAEFGLDWFFNGYYRAQSWDVWPKVNATGRLAYGTFPGYFPQYCAGDLIELVNVDDRPWNIERAMTALREGCGVSIGLGWYNYNGVRNGGHAITLWGYVKDRYSSAVTDKSTYCALIISDSDNNITGGSDRRGAPDTLQVEPIGSASLADMDTWCFYDYGWGDGYLEDFTILKPWSEDIPVDGNAETEEALSVFSPWDIAITKVETVVSDMTADVFGRNQTIQPVPYITVRGDRAYTGPLALTLTVTNSAGTKVWESTEQIEEETYAVGEIRYFIIDRGMTLPAGTYTVTATVSGMTADVYKNNNTASKTFTVSSYSASTYDSLRISSASMEKMGEYGVSGRLTLNYSGKLGFTPQQYLVDITYDGGESWKTIYAGKTRPTVIENLYLDLSMTGSTYVSLSVRASDTSGYSRVLSDKVPVSVADYYGMAVYSAVHSLKVQEGETDFSDNGKLQFDVVDCGSIPVQNDYLLTLMASSSWGKDVILLRNYYIPSRSGYDHTFSTLSKMADLPAGEYDLWAYVEYDPIVDGYYQSYNGKRLGTLSVLSNGTSEEDWYLTCYTPDVSAAEVCLPYELLAPAGSTFDVEVRYWSDSGTGGAIYSRTYADFWGGWDYDVFSLPVDPNTTYSYEMEILQGENVVASAEAGTFTTPSFDGPAIGAEEETFFTLERGEGRVYALTAPAAGTYTISAKGPMGLLKVRDGDWKTYSQSFNGLGESLQVTMNAGETAYLFVTAEMGGEFTLSTKAAGIETETVLLTPEETALTLKSGGSVSCRTYTALDTNGTVTLTVAGADGYVRYYDAQGTVVTRKFTLDGTEVALPVTAGSAASFQVYAYEGGEYTLSYTSDVMLYSRTADGVGFLPGEAYKAVTLAALYRDDGKMLDVKAVTAGSGLRLQGGEGARVDFLTLSDSYLPEAGVKELALASLQMEPS